MDTLKGAINILTDKSDPANPIYKTLYPKTISSQVEGFDDRVKDLVGDTITVSGTAGSRKTIIGNLEADQITTSSGNAINATVTNATNATTATNDSTGQAITGYIGAVSSVAGALNQIVVKTGAEVSTSAAGTTITINNVENAQKDTYGTNLTSYIGSVSAGAASNQVVVKTGANLHDGAAGTTITIDNVANATNANTATSAGKLSNSYTINGMPFTGEANIANYVTCSSDATAVTKAVTLTGFVLATGASLKVKFTNGNTATDATLQINTNTAKAIYYQGAAVTSGLIVANATIELVYNGTQFDIVGIIGSGSGGSSQTGVGIPTTPTDLVYDGTLKTPFSGVDTAAMTKSGTYEASEAGTYTATFTLKAGYYWTDDGSTSIKNIEWTIERAEISTVPSQADTATLIYDGSAKQPTSWNNYNSTQLTLSCSNQINAGSSYTATFTPTANYQWSTSIQTDTTAAKTVNWAIAQATPTLSISPTATTKALSLGETYSVTVTSNTDGAIRISSASTSIASLSATTVTTGNSFTITGTATGTSVVTVTTTAGANYKAVTSNKTISVTVTVPAYGIQYTTAGGHVRGTNWKNVDATGTVMTIADSNRYVM